MPRTPNELIINESTAILQAHSALIALVRRYADVLDRALPVIAAARAAHNGASVETRRTAMAQLGVALDAFDATSSRPSLESLKQFGTSIELTWGEDDDLWTLAWISGGKRYTAQGSDPEPLYDEVMNEAAKEPAGYTSVRVGTADMCKCNACGVLSIGPYCTGCGRDNSRWQ